MPCVQASGVNFLPFEQRMTRDFEAWKEQRQEHLGREHAHGHKDFKGPPVQTDGGALAPVSVKQMSREQTSVDELAGLIETNAVASRKLVRSNSIAF